MKWIDKLKKDDAGFVLVLAIVLMAGMAAVGIAVVTTSTTDMLIARNSVESRTAFYLAEIGREEAIGRLRILPGATNHAGESYDERSERRAKTDGTAGTYVLETFTLANSPLADVLDGDFSVDIDYAYEASETWCDERDSDSDGEDCDDLVVVLYCFDFKFTGAGGGTVQGTCYENDKPVAGPTYKIESTGTTDAGSTAKVVSYIAISGLNVEPPFGDVYTDSTLSVSGAAGIDGSVCAQSTDVGGVACADDADCDDDCSPPPAPMSDDAFAEYLGLSLDEIKSYADVRIDQTSNNATYDPDDWGTTLCSNNIDTNNVDEHICNNESKLVFIDNVVDLDVNNARLSGGSGRGILIITGNLELTGNLMWEGVIFVAGSLGGAGDITIIGTMMAHNAVDFNGSVIAFGSVEVANSVALGIAIPKPLRWYRDRI